VSGRKTALNIMKYANHDRICRDLRDVFGDVRFDGKADELTNVEATGDQTGTVWSLSDCPQLKSIEDVSDSILAAFEGSLCCIKHESVGCDSSYKLARPRVWVNKVSARHECSIDCVISAPPTV
jgi:hypothetical protein